MSRRRAAAGKRWSASSSTQAWDRRGDRVADGDTAANKVTVRYRLDGLLRKRSFSGPESWSHAEAFQALLQVAYCGDWPADANHRPVPPVAAPVTASPVVVESASDEPEVAQVPAPAPCADQASQIRDVTDLTEWKRRSHRVTPKRRSGGKRSSGTLEGYDSELKFIDEHLRYAAGDPRLDHLGLASGASMSVAGPQHGVSTADLLDFIDLRASTNLRTRAANERKLQRWAKDIAKELTRAGGDGRAPVVPPRPELKPEDVSARTIESSCRELKGLFTSAYERGVISYQPWTDAVDDYVVRARPVVHTVRSLPSARQVALLAETIANLRLDGPFRDGKRVVNSGERYRAMVRLAGRLGPREEEIVAMRRSWFELDGDRPRVGLRNAEVRIPTVDGHRKLTPVPLKHRDAGHTRWSNLLDDRELVDDLSYHLEHFVPPADPTSDDPEKRDPRVFTTHTGAPIDFGNWMPRWWYPTLQICFTDAADEHLRELPFGRMRAAAITGWLVDGRTLAWCAQQAGNSQAVIEKHYRGVIEEIDYEHLHSGSNAPPLSLAPASIEVSKLPVEELLRMQELLTHEMGRRAGAVAAP